MEGPSTFGEVGPTILAKSTLGLKGGKVGTAFIRRLFRKELRRQIIFRPPTQQRKLWRNAKRRGKRDIRMSKKRRQTWLPAAMYVSLTYIGEKEWGVREYAWGVCLSFKGEQGGRDGG